MAVRSNKCLLISAIVAVSVMCAVGCNKSHVEKNDTAGAADGATDTVVGNTDSMAGHTDAAGNADPTSAGTDGMKICGSTSLSPEDATKWDCVPDIGFWCTDPDGCPVNGNTAMVGTRLIWVQPIPKGVGYIYKAELPNELIPECTDDKKSSGCRSASEWKCNLAGGCACGAGRVNQGEQCYVDTYEAKSGTVDTKCNANNCLSFCKNDQCVCGDAVIPEGAKELECEKHERICMEHSGCTVDGHDYALYQSWISYELRETENEEELSDESELTVQEQKIDQLCGKQNCPEHFECINGQCVIKHEDEDSNGSTKEFYCDETQGCLCDDIESICPKGAFCKVYETDRGWSDLTAIGCLRVSKVKDKASAIEYMNLDSYDRSDYGEHYYYFSKDYYKKSKFRNEHYILRQKDGKDVNMYVVCSKPGCDCGGFPLKEGYLCVEQHVVFDRKSPEQYTTCHKPYVEYTYDRMFSGSSCDVGDNVIEQVCFSKKGCACGADKIQMGDACINEHGQCSSTKPRPGCMCGSEQLGNDYGCYHGTQICQAGIKIFREEDFMDYEENLTCSCYGKDIHVGDICTKDKVICGVNSRTAGCICGEKTLREDYRCFQEKQICACDEYRDAENECTCKCGAQDVSIGTECKDDDTPFIVKTEVTVNENDEKMVNCGNKIVNIGNTNKTNNNSAAPSVNEDGSDIDVNDLGDLKNLCTCGTGTPAPDEGYGCKYRLGTIGLGSEFGTVYYLDGWTCLDINGCQCGDKLCYPDMCLGSDACDDNVFHHESRSVECVGHVLPLAIVSNRYACYDEYKFSYSPGWYCSNDEGCACGDRTCAQWESCLAPGYCSKHKLGEQAQTKLKYLKVKRRNTDY